MNGLLCHLEIALQQGLALLLINRGSVLGYPLAVQPSEDSITLCPISGRTYVGLSTLWPALAELDDGDASVVGSPALGVGFEQGRVDVRHCQRIKCSANALLRSLRPPMSQPGSGLHQTVPVGTGFR